LVAETLQRQHGIPPSAFVAPGPATREQLMRVHTARYLDDLANLRWTPRTLRSELPLNKEIVAMVTLACGGTIRAAELALQEGTAIHLGGGFHHASAEKAEGFCYLNDLAVAIREMQARGKIQRAMVIDCDLHQGNGTAKIFEKDPAVFTFSIHQDDLYPIKEKSDHDIHLPMGVRDEAGTWPSGSATVTSGLSARAPQTARCASCTRSDSAPSAAFATTAAGQPDGTSGPT
jgi:acetoin utilization deacetylase AcuC-like enzyme